MTPSGYYARQNGEWVKFEGNPVSHCAEMVLRGIYATQIGFQPICVLTRRSLSE
jgi:hypothetical protein